MSSYPTPDDPAAGGSAGPLSSGASGPPSSRRSSGVTGSASSPGSSGVTGSGASPGSRRAVGRFPDYATAQAAVDYLSDQRFPVEAVTIVGTGIRYEEKVTGRRDLVRAAIEGAISGAILGALFGWILGIFSIVDPLVTGLVLAFWGALIGAVLGALIGAGMHAAQGGRRDFASVGGFTADTYEVLVDEARADEATNLLKSMPTLRR